MPASFTLSDFSEMVSAALDGYSFDEDYGLQAPVASRDGGRRYYSDASKYTNNHPSDSEKNALYGGLVDSYADSDIESYRGSYHRSPYIYNNHYNSSHNMLLVAPPGPLPPSVPIIAASMSAIDLGTNCLSLGIGMGSTGCGGTPNKSALEATDASNSPTTQITNSSSSTPSPNRNRPLALLAKIKRQLSKSNVAVSSNSPSPSPTNTTNPNPPLPSTDLYYTLPAEQIRRSDRVSFAPAPSFHPAWFTGTESDAPETASNNMSAPKRSSAAKKLNQKHKQQQSSLRRRHSLSDSMSEYSLASMTVSLSRSGSVLSVPSMYSVGDESVFVGGSVHSYVDPGVASIIGSSSSFFAALDRGKDGRKGRRGSGEEQEDDDHEDEFIEPASFEGGHFDFPDNAGYINGDRRNGLHALSDPDDGLTDHNGHGSQELDNADEQSMHSFVPYMPLIMQHERRQQGREARVSLEDVASICARSRTSIASLPSVASNREQRRVSSSSNTKAPKPGPSARSVVRRHVPPPLHPSPPSSSIVQGRAHQYAPYHRKQQQPNSPTSSASSRSPITPSTPFFTASEASLEGDSEEDGESDDAASRISPSATRRSQKDEDKDKALSARLSFGDTTASSLRGANIPGRVRVSVLPPTPTVPDLVPGSTTLTSTSTSTSSSTSTAHPASSSSAVNSYTSDDAHYHSTAVSSKRRSRQNMKNKSPPMSPPPSGPLPLLPASPPPSNATLNVIIPSGSQRDSLLTQSSIEYAAHCHPSPLARTLSSGSDFWDEEDVLNIPDDSGIAFATFDLQQQYPGDTISAVDQQLFFSAHHFISEPEPRPDRTSISSAQSTAESESEYASLSTSRSDSRSSTSEASNSDSDSDSDTDTAEAARSRAAAILEANTRANADGLFMPVEKIKIEIGRQQVPKARAAQSGKEWTLGLGLEMPKSSVATVAPSVSVLSTSTSSKEEGTSTEFPVLVGDAATTVVPLSMKTKRSMVGSFAVPPPVSPVPVWAATAAAVDDRRGLRVRTKSEPALGARAGAVTRRKKSSSGAGVAPNEDWTLSLPLPSSKRADKMPAATDATKTDPKSIPRRSHPIHVGEVDILVTDVDASVEDMDMSTSENVDANSDTDDIDLELEMEMDLSSTESTPTQESDQVILCVPRLVSRGSGIERATTGNEPRARTRSTVFEDALAPEVVRAQVKANVDQSLAKLNTLSADLARFNEMLRAGGARLRQGKALGRGTYAGEKRVNGFLHGDVELGRGLVRKKSSGLKLQHARSFGVLDEAPPKDTTILRMASVGNLLPGDSSRVKAKTTAPLPYFAPSPPSPWITPALIDDSPTLPQPDTPVLIQQEHLRGPTSPTRPLSRSLSRTSWRNSDSSSLTITPANANAKMRAPLPFAPPPSSFAYRPTSKADSVTNGAVGRLETESTASTQTRGLASGSALNRRGSSYASIRSSSVEVKTTPVETVDHVGPVEDGTKTTEPSTTETSMQVVESRVSVSSNSSTSTTSSATTPTQASVPLPPLTICTTPSTSPRHLLSSRRASTSSVKSNDSSTSSASLTPTLSPTNNSSTLPTPLASSFPAPPSTHPMPSVFGEALRARLTAAGTKSPAPASAPAPAKEMTSVETPERKSESSSVSSSPKGIVLTFDERIRRLQELGMEAVVVRGVSTSPNSSSISKATKEKKKEKEADSDCSDFYYSARSSFSSAC